MFVKADMLCERVTYYSQGHLEWRERLISANALLTWAPAATGHPTLYQGCISLDLETPDLQEAFVRLNVYTGEDWTWMHYPVSSSRYLVQLLKQAGWKRQSPTLVLRARSAELHIPQVRKIAASKVIERKHDPNLVTVAVDLNVRNLAVVTVRQCGNIVETVFMTDHGLDVPARRLSRTRPDPIASWNAEGTPGKPKGEGRRERTCPGLFRKLGYS